MDYFRGPGDYILFLNIFLWAIALPLLISRHSLDELLRSISPGSIRPRHGTRRAVVFVNWWLNRNILMLRPTCLKRSLLLYRFLVREGLNVEIHCGIRKTGNGTDGHSWLTLNGKPFLQDSLTAGQFKETFVFGAERKRGG